MLAILNGPVKAQRQELFISAKNYFLVIVIPLDNFSNSNCNEKEFFCWVIPFPTKPLSGTEVIGQAHKFVTVRALGQVEG